MSTTTWRDIKKQIIAIRTVLRSKDISIDERKKLERSITDLEDSLDNSFSDSPSFQEEIILRRDFLTKNFGLLDIFSTLWFLVISHVDEDGVLNKDGYMKIFFSIYVALCGFQSFDDIRKSLENDYDNNQKVFGAINKTIFFDILFELIETWSEIIEKSCLAAFSWVLLDSIVDLSVNPARLKYIRDVVCFLQFVNEADLIAKFSMNKRIRASLTIGKELLDRVPEVQRKLRGRKLSQAIAEKSLMMLEVLKARQGNKFEDSEDEQSTVGKSDHLVTMPGVPLVDSLPQEIVKNDDKNDASPLGHRKDFRIPMEDEDDQSGTTENADDLSVGDTSSTRRHLKHKFNTMSFMEYLKARRLARHQLNGDTSSAASHSRSGVLSINSLDWESLPVNVTIPPPQQQLQQQSLQQSQHQQQQQQVPPQTIAEAASSGKIKSGTGGQPSDHVESRQLPPGFDIVGKAMVAKLSSSGHSSSGDAKTKKIEFPMKNVLLNASSIGSGVGHNSTKPTKATKQKMEQTISVRNGFNADLGLSVKSINIPCAGVVNEVAAAPVSGAYIPSSSLISGAHIAPVSEASIALAELSALRSTTLLPNGTLPGTGGPLGKMFDAENSITASDSMITIPDDVSVTQQRHVRLIISDELNSQPEDRRLNIDTDIEYTSAEALDSRALNSDVSADELSFTQETPLASGAVPSVQTNILPNEDTQSERSLSPPKLSSTQNRNILGPFPSAYFLSSGNEFSVTESVNKRVIPTSAYPQVSHSDGVFKSLLRSGNKNRSKDGNKEASYASSDGWSASSKPVFVEAAPASSLYSSGSGSRGIFKGLGLCVKPDRDSMSYSNSSNNQNQRDNQSASATTRSLQELPKTIRQEDAHQTFPSSFSTDSFPRNINTNFNLMASSQSQSMPSLLIKPVTTIQRSSTAFNNARKSRMEDASDLLTSDAHKDEKDLVTDKSLRALTILSNLDFEHLRNSIEVSVAGSHYHHPRVKGAKQPEMALRQVNLSPVKYECHRSYLTITGSSEVEYSIPSSAVLNPPNVGSKSIFSNAASNSLIESGLKVESELLNGRTSLDFTSYQPTTSTTSSHFYVKEEFSHAPWVPHELLLPSDHNRSNRILGWREKLETLKSVPHVPASVTMTIKSQDAVRSSFEEFVKSSTRKKGR